IGGFDTHANQAGTHANLMQEVGNSLQAFLDDLNKAGDGKRVLVLVFSEFGRRLTENASGGTDHGTAPPLFFLGGRPNAGVHGPYPNLQDLDGAATPSTPSTSARFTPRYWTNGSTARARRCSARNSLTWACSRRRQTDSHCGALDCHSAK